MRTRLAVLLFVVAGTMISGAAAAKPDATVLGVTTSNTLVRLDARTLAPVRGTRQLRLQGKVRGAALSPDRSRVALLLAKSVLLVNVKTLRIVSRLSIEAGQANRLLWLGDGSLVAIGPSVIGFEYAVVSTSSGLVAGTESPSGVDAVLPEGVVLGFDGPPAIAVVGFTEVGLQLPQLAGGPSAAAADIVHDRVFAVSATGVVAEIDNVSTLNGIADPPQAVTYHPVQLNGRPFAAAWAGRGRIALWGQDGLGIIDTTDWSTHAIAPLVDNAVATPYGVLAWNSRGSDGLAVYTSDGSLRFRVLDRRTIAAVVTIGDYAYVRADGRFSVDLRTGHVTGPLANGTTLIQPSLVPIP